MTLSVPEILEELRENRGYFPQEAVEAAVERREEIVPELLRILDEAIERPEALLADPGAMSHFYALYLLAQFREPAAFPRVVRFFGLRDEVATDVMDDMLLEDLPRLLASLSAGNVQPLLELIENPEASEWVRGAGVEALEELVFSEQLSREEAVAHLGELLRGRLDRNPSNVWCSLVSVAADLHATELAPLLRRAYDEELVDLDFASLEEIEEDLREPREAVLERARSKCRGLIEDTVEEMSEWDAFEELAPFTCPDDLDWLVPSLQPVRREGPKVGRNDPCPCGSGKKFKRCCGSHLPGADSLLPRT
jgi:hypothetical protein